MHEQSLINDFMNKIKNIAIQENADKIIEVSVKLGALSHFSPEHFIDHFNTAAKNTIAEGAKLDIILSDDIHDKDAQNVRLLSVKVNE